MTKLDEMEANLIRAYDLAKQERPNLSVKVIPSVPIPGQGRPPKSDIMVVVHEHEFVGGVCVNGCTDRRPVS